MQQFGINKDLCIRQKKKDRNYRRGVPCHNKDVYSLVPDAVTWCCALYCMTSHDDWHMCASVCCGTPWGVSYSGPAGTAWGPELAQHTGEIYSVRGVTESLPMIIYPRQTSFGKKNEKFWFDFNFDGFGSRWHIYLDVSLRTALKQSRSKWVWSSSFFFFSLGPACSCRCST